MPVPLFVSAHCLAECFISNESNAVALLRACELQKIAYSQTLIDENIGSWIPDLFPSAFSSPSLSSLIPVVVEAWGSRQGVYQPMRLVCLLLSLNEPKAMTAIIELEVHARRKTILANRPITSNSSLIALVDGLGQYLYVFCLSVRIDHNISFFRAEDKKTSPFWDLCSSKTRCYP
jgi:hypothetical protein